MKTLAAVLLVVAGFQQQCNVQSFVGDEATKGIRRYFPKAEIVSNASCVLMIETHVDNVSYELLALVANGLVSSEEMPKLRMGMEFARLNFFVLEFNDTDSIVFDRPAGVAYVFGTTEAAARHIYLTPYVCTQ